MYEPTMTLEERERLHYITNSPTYSAIAQALDGEEAVDDRIEELEGENKELQNQHDAEFDRAEKAEERAADLEGQLDDSKQEAEIALAECAQLRAVIDKHALDLL